MTGRLEEEGWLCSVSCHTEEGALCLVGSCLALCSAERLMAGVRESPTVARKEGLQGFPKGVYGLMSSLGDPARRWPGPHDGETFLDRAAMRIPTRCRGQLQGRLCIAVLATVYCRAFHMGTSVQQQLRGGGGRGKGDTQHGREWLL